MLEEKKLVKTSKFLSLVLRHKPSEANIELDNNGWTDVNILLSNIAKRGFKLSLEELKYLVENNNKKRFAFNDDFSKIRASQGHSVEVDLDYTPEEPPEYLYHGTATKNLDSIFQTGLEKRNRNHVHLSKDIETAINVGSRHGKPIVLKVKALEMHKKGFEFFLSANGVWLVDNIPVEFIEN